MSWNQYDEILKSHEYQMLKSVAAIGCLNFHKIKYYPLFEIDVTSKKITSSMPPPNIS